MRRIATCLAFLCALLAVPFAVQARVGDSQSLWRKCRKAFRSPPAPAPVPAGLARFGPFRVVNAKTAALVDVTDEHSPAHFAAMLRAYPELAMLELVDCPGTYDDMADLRLERMIRAAGLSPMCRGAVRTVGRGSNCFLPGWTGRWTKAANLPSMPGPMRTGWRQATIPPMRPKNRKYLNYYQEMGMDADTARAFYAMTNSVPFGGARWLGAAEMRRWLGQNDQPVTPPAGPVQAVPVLAYLDLNAGLN